MTTTVTIPTQWLIAIVRLLTKYFRGCLNCKSGRCPACREFENWQPKLAKLVEDARGVHEKTGTPSGASALGPGGQAR